MATRAIHLVDFLRHPTALLRRAYTIDRRTAWLLVAFVAFYGVGDVASTYAAYSYLGTFAYETSAPAHAAFDSLGYSGVVILKAVVCAWVILFLLPLRLVYPYMSEGIIIGSALGGFVITASNFAIPVLGHSLAVGDMSSLVIAGLCVQSFGVFGIGMQVGELLMDMYRKWRASREQGKQAAADR